MANSGAPLDPNAQPSFPFNAAKRTERDISELLGLAKGMLADGSLNDDEARYLQSWGQNHVDVLDKWPVSVIFSRLTVYFADGQISDAERSDLEEMLRLLVGGQLGLMVGFDASTQLPLDTPSAMLALRFASSARIIGHPRFGNSRLVP